MAKEFHKMATLLLLVGTNPLPNYVVAKYLYTRGPVELKPEKVLLIHTTATKEIAVRLQFALENELGVKFEPLHCFDDPFNPVLQTNLTGKLRRFNSIHLNYTGGTKALGVQVHQLVKGLEKPGFKYSYLDASDHLLRFDDGRFLPETKTGGRGDMRLKVEISLETIRGLHNLKNGEPEKGKAEYPALGRWLFDNLILNPAKGEMLEVYKKWITQSWLQPFKDGKNQAKEADLLNHPWPGASGFEEFGELVKANANWTPNSSGNFDWNDLTKDNKKRLVKYLDGAWLERPLYELLTSNTVKYSPPLTASFFDVNLMHNDAGKNMQLDTVLLRGYELANISMTTSTGEPLIKSKAFEAYYRAQQLGGEQAMAVMISLAGSDGVKNVTADLETDFGTDAQLRLKILGLPHLRKLAQGVLTGDDFFES
jgi:hypothetical protein